MNINLGGKNVLKNQDLIVQVKHTGKELPEKITNSVRRKIFEKEKKQVEELVKRNKLDTTYIIFSNYDLPSLQEQKLHDCYNVANNVLIIGKETLSQWLGDSRELQMKVIRYYPRGHLTDLTDCPKAVQSIQLLERYREDLENITDVEAFTKAKEIVESDKGLVFITGVPGSGKTTVAKQLIVQLFDEYDSVTYYDITYPNDFDKYWIPDEKYIFFMDEIDSNSMNEWSKLEKKLKVAIKEGSKFVFAGNAVVLEEAHSSTNKFYDRLCNAAINLSDQQFNLSKDKKQEMLKKHVDMGDIDNLTKEALLKDDMVSHAAEINCPCFPLVAESLGSRDRLEQFKAAVPPMPPEYNQMFLDEFFKWVQSELESPMPKRRRQNFDPRSTDNNRDNITGM